MEQEKVYYSYDFTKYLRKVTLVRLPIIVLGCVILWIILSAFSNYLWHIPIKNLWTGISIFFASLFFLFFIGNLLSFSFWGKWKIEITDNFFNLGKRYSGPAETLEKLNLYYRGTWQQPLEDLKIPWSNIKNITFHQGDITQGNIIRLGFFVYIETIDQKIYAVKIMRPFFGFLKSTINPIIKAIEMAGYSKILDTTIYTYNPSFSESLKYLNPQNLPDKLTTLGKFFVILFSILWTPFPAMLFSLLYKSSYPEKSKQIKNLAWLTLLFEIAFLILLFVIMPLISSIPK